MEMNANLHNGDVSSLISLINSHNLPQCNESINSNDTNWGVNFFDVSGGHCYINSHTAYEENNNNSID